MLLLLLPLGMGVVDLLALAATEIVCVCVCMSLRWCVRRPRRRRVDLSLLCLWFSCCVVVFRPFPACFVTPPSSCCARAKGGPPSCAVAARSHFFCAFRGSHGGARGRGVVPYNDYKNTKKDATRPHKKRPKRPKNLKKSLRPTDQLGRNVHQKKDPVALVALTQKSNKNNNKIYTKIDQQKICALTLIG